MARTVVIGAGVAGLAAALRLVDFGHEVTVLEQNSRAGGQVSADVIDGICVETGPTAFTLPAVFRDLFRKTGRPLERELELVPLDPSVRYVFPDGGQLDMPNASRARITAALDDAFGPGAGAQWEALIRDAECMWGQLRPRLLDHPPGWRDLLWFRVHPRSKQYLRRANSLRELGMLHLQEPNLRLILDSYATLYGATPTKAPAALASLAYIEQTFGTWTVRGGLTALIEALERRLLQQGATMRFGTPAIQVKSKYRQVTGVQVADGETIPADVVVSTAPPGQLGFDSLRARHESTVPSDGHSVFSLVLSVRHPLDLPQRTILLTEDGPNVAVTYRSGDDPSGPCALALHADCPSHGDGADQTDWSDPDTAETHAQQLLGLAASRGVQVKDDVLNMHIRSPYDLEREYGATGGRIFGQAWHGNSCIRQRRKNRSFLRGLFYAGASTHPGAGIPAVAISAALAVDAIGRA
ncbi:phytoene desaturase family protein [Phytoactinopolyspora halophila]|uniref:phytoene desaturase family protein n=1 Tax=Phytoactinopolyspora halophila TaxID=1981511 RepID=UPI0013148283|nr:FAD-dependent oxidoreductase [Phytoactinopolyspora halophila]